MIENSKINCTVCDCEYNVSGQACSKSTICVCSAEGGCTRCGSYKCKWKK